jgi:hypothetical protein
MLIPWTCLEIGCFDVVVILTLKLLDQDNAEELMVGGEEIIPPHLFISQLICVQMFYCDVYRLLSS